MSLIERCYTINHVARLADQSRSTINRRITDGLIKITRLADGSKRIPESEVARYLGVDPVDDDEHCR
jgi:predicted site-specific integrase-resolvase